MVTVFLLHLCLDHVWIIPVKEFLERNHHQVYFDGFPLGCDIGQVTLQRMEDSEIILICGSQQFLNGINSPNIQRELNLVEERFLNRSVLLLWDDAILPQFPEFLRNRMGAVFLHRQFNDLSEALVRMEIDRTFASRRGEMTRHIPAGGWSNLSEGVTQSFQIPPGKYMGIITGHSSGRYFGRLCLEELRNNEFVQMGTPYETGLEHGPNHPFGGTWNGNNANDNPFTIRELISINLYQRTTVRVRMLRRSAEDVNCCRGVEVALIRL